MRCDAIQGFNTIELYSYRIRMLYECHTKYSIIALNFEITVVELYIIMFKANVRDCDESHPFSSVTLIHSCTSTSTCTLHKKTKHVCNVHERGVCEYWFGGKTERKKRKAKKRQDKKKNVPTVRHPRHVVRSVITPQTKNDMLLFSRL